MKKFLIAMLMMAVVVAGVFAVDNAALKLTVTVEEHVPTFNLAIAAAETKFNAASDLVETNGANTKTAVTANGTTAGELLANGEALTVTFGVQQNFVSYIKTQHGYTFTAEATNLVLLDNDTPKATPAANEKFTAGAPTAVTGNAYIGATYGAWSDNTVTYTGTKYIPDANAAEIATFSVTWAANADALVGDYEATVTLTVATV